MILILASRWDATARDLAAAWAGQRVGIMTARDLSRAGWCQRLGERDGAHDRDTALERDCAVSEGRLIAEADIRGVLTCLPWVTEGELPEIVASDRAYVAAEMSAFLLFWLSRLTCPVLNVPTPTCLAGPGWRAERWARAAAEIGMTVRPVQRDTRANGSQASPPRATHLVTVVGAQVIGEVHPELKQRARLLAELAQVGLLTVRFCGVERGAAFCGADPLPALDEPAVRAAVLEHLTARGLS